MAGETHPSDWRHAAPLTKQLALVALVAVIGGVWLASHFAASAARAAGPTLIARNAAGETLLANGSTLFLVDAREAKTRSLPVEDLGLRGPVMSLSSDGPDWYLGDDATGMLYRCDLQTRKCAAALQATGGRRMFGRAHHVAFTADHIYITDTRAHRLLTFDRDGTAAGSTRTAPLALCFPNGIVAMNGQLYVADTNNFRIARIAVAAPAQSATELRTHEGAPLDHANCSSKTAALTMNRDARPPARPDRIWPASVLHTSTGEWWLIQMDGHMRLGDVIRYDASGRPRGRVTLPPDADPIELIEDRGQVLITDAALSRVHRVTLQGQSSGAWGPRDLHEKFGAISAERDFRRSLQYLSYGLIAAGVLAALFVVGFELRRQRAQRWSTFGNLTPVTVQPVPLGREPAWLTIEPEVLRRTRPVMWLLGAYTLAMFGILLWLAPELRVDTPIGRYRVFVTAAFSSVALLLLVIAAVNLRRLPRRRIGISRAEVLYDPGSGDISRSRWEDVRVGPRGMLIGRHLVQIVDVMGRSLYSRPEYEARLLSHISPTAFLGDTRLLIEAMRRGNVTLWITSLAFAVYLVFTLLRWLQPGLMTHLSAQLIDLFR